MTWLRLWLRRLSCRHLNWEPVDATFTETEDAISVTWENQRCLRCGSFRDGNWLKPGESIQIPVDERYLR